MGRVLQQTVEVLEALIDAADEMPRRAHRINERARRLHQGVAPRLRRAMALCVQAYPAHELPEHAHAVALHSALVLLRAQALLSRRHLRQQRVEALGIAGKQRHGLLVAAPLAVKVVDVGRARAEECVHRLTRSHWLPDAHSLRLALSE